MAGEENRGVGEDKARGERRQTGPSEDKKEEIRMNKQNIQEENNPNNRKKKKKEDIGEEQSDIQKRSTKEEHEENVQKKVQMSSTSTSTNLQRPGPGTRASSRRLATPGWQQKVGDQSSSSSSSPGNHTTFASIQLNTMAGRTPGKGVILIESLGSVIAANSCSTAADISATVLAGNFEKYCTQGRR